MYPAGNVLNKIRIQGVSMGGGGRGGALVMGTGGRIDCCIRMRAFILVFRI